VQRILISSATAVRRLLPLLAVFALLSAPHPLPRDGVAEGDSQPAAHPSSAAASSSAVEQRSPVAPPATRVVRGAPPAGLAPALARAAGAARVSAVGIHVREVASGDTVFARRAEEPFIVASNAKLFTTAAALEILGPGYLFETSLAMRGRVEDGVLRGDLAVRGGGDPLFSWRQAGGDPYLPFRAWAAILREQGIERVEGSVFLDHGLFGDQRLNPAWNPDKYLEWYQVPVDSLGFHENVVRVKALPAATPGQPARLVTEPALDYFEIDGEVRTLPSWSGNLMVVHRPPGSERLRVSGGVFVGARQLAKPISVADPVALFGAALRRGLAEEGVRVAGPDRPVENLPGLVWRPVATHRSALLDVIEITNHESNNLFADTLLMLVGAMRCGGGTWDQGVRAVEDVLVTVGGLEVDHFSLVDGSGLARGNRMRPADVTRFLAAATRRPWAEEYITSLPTGGSDPSSLRDRLRGVRGRVFAKTGTIAGVSALSGYAYGRSGRMYAFSVLAHGGAGPARSIQDAVAEAIVEQG
jgi:serine-type D-Ala-D-Ala carboxypeptidase/endopeptidase (penicillin-binding protein 4)